MSPCFRPIAAVGLVLLVTAVAASTAHADSAPPPWTRQVTVGIVVEVAEPFPDYVFYWVDRTVPVGPRRATRNTVGRLTPSTDTTTLRRPSFRVSEFRPEPDHPVRFSGEFYGGPKMYAVPRAAAAVDVRDRDEMIAAIDRGEVPGATTENASSAARVARADGPKRIIIHYRIERQPSGDGVVFRRLSDGLASPGDPWATADPQQARLRWVIVAVCIAGALVGLGLWWAVRRRPADQAPTSPPTE